MIKLVTLKQHSCNNRGREKARCGSSGWRSAGPIPSLFVALLIVLLGIVSILRMPKDIFPEIAEPIVTLIWQYVGIPADAFEKQVTIFSEQQISTTVSNIKRIESHTINGKNVIRIYFQPSVRIDQAVSQITATSQTIIRRMPPGQQPPQIVQYDASSVPILQIALGSDTMSEQQLYDQGLWLVRNEVVPVPGATVPLPYGGRPRLVMIDADPVRMHAKGVTVKEINDALNRQNVNLPTGSTQIGSRDYILSINNSPEKISELGNLPIKTVGGTTVYIGDVADVRDGYNEQTSLVRHDGRKSALITVLKSGGASTLDIIRDVRQRLSNVTLPDGLSLSFLFDQSVFVCQCDARGGRRRLDGCGIDGTAYPAIPRQLALDSGGGDIDSFGHLVLDHHALGDGVFAQSDDPGRACAGGRHSCRRCHGYHRKHSPPYGDGKKHQAVDP